MSDFLSRDQLLAAQALPYEDVEIAELGRVRVQGLSLAQRDEYESAVVENRGRNVAVNRENIRAKLIVRCLVNGNGERLLKDDDVALVGALAAKTLDRVFAVCQKLSGLSPDDLEVLAGN